MAKITMNSWPFEAARERHTNYIPRIGDICLHKGRKVRVTDGQFWGTHGVSNFWYWKDVETGEEGHGYGGELCALEAKERTK